MGTLYAEGRWNKAGQWIIYTSPSIALAKLETLANDSRLPIQRVVMTIEVSKSTSVKKIHKKDLPNNWMQNPYPAGLFLFTSQFIQENKHLLLEVPSSQSTRESNFLINVTHPQFNKCIRLKSVDDESFDSRLK